MTREEAIEHLEELLNEEDYFDDFGIPNKHGEALSLAITALNGDLGWEFIIFMLEKNYPEDIFGGIDDLGGRTLKAIRWLEKERAALRGPVPDPETGLVNCGCGGKAYMADWSLFRGHLYSVHCLDCNTQTDHCESQKEAKTRWNIAMGYKGDE